MTVYLCPRCPSWKTPSFTVLQYDNKIVCNNCGASYPNNPGSLIEIDEPTAIWGTEPSTGVNPAQDASFIRQFLAYLKNPSWTQKARPRWCDIYTALEAGAKALDEKAERESGTVDGNSM